MNRRTLLLSLLAGTAGLALPSVRALAAGLPGMAGSVFTADEQGASISRIDLASGRVTTVRVGIAPHNVQLTPDGSRLLAVGTPPARGDAHVHATSTSTHADAAPGQLLAFDPKRLAAKPLSIPVGAHPAHVVAIGDGHLAFVTLSGSDAVAVVDLVAKTVVRRIATGRYPHGLRLSPDNRVLAVANVEDGSVSVIDPAGSELARIPVGRAPVQVGFTPDGTRLYVSLRDEDRVAVIDMRSGAVAARIAVGRGPIQVHATPDGRFVYVANQGSRADPADTVSVIDVTAGTVVETIRTGLGAHGVAVSPDGRFVFVTNILDASVSVIDAARRAVIATYAVGKGPNGITVAAAPGRV